MARVDVQEVLREATGKWDVILRQLGVNEGVLNKKHHPCPVCKDGQDRFRFEDKDGQGTWYCSHCESIIKGIGFDGIGMVRLLERLDFIPAVRKVGEILFHDVPEERGGHALPPPRIERPAEPVVDERAAQTLRRVWKESIPASESEQVMAYLHARGLGGVTFLPPRVLRFHPRMPYRDELGDFYGYHPALLALAQGPGGEGVSLHRTFLAGDRKLELRDKAGNPLVPKKLMRGKLKMPGSAIRLFDAAETVAIAEGIETAYAVHLMTGLPVWSAIAAPFLRKVVFPAEVRRVEIFADHDLPDARGHCAGQMAAEQLRERLVEAGLEVIVHLPKKPGTDFLDEFLSW